MCVFIFDGFYLASFHPHTNSLFMIERPHGNPCNVHVCVHIRWILFCITPRTPAHQTVQRNLAYVYYQCRMVERISVRISNMPVLSSILDVVLFFFLYVKILFCFKFKEMVYLLYNEYNNITQKTNITI